MVGVRLLVLLDRCMVVGPELGVRRVRPHKGGIASIVGEHEMLVADPVWRQDRGISSKQSNAFLDHEFRIEG